MSTCSLTRVPEDILLYITDLLQPEDLLYLIQTCKSLYYLTTVRGFWLSCAKLLARRRRVHYLPLEELDIPQLRAAIFHTLKLDTKWSGEVDPSPVRSIEIDPASHTTGLPAESQAVTWVWFLDDGIHITCVVGDTIVQVWDLSNNRPVLSFSVNGTLVRASQYSDKDHFVMVGSVNTSPGAELWHRDTPVNFKVWVCDWQHIDTTTQISPLFIVPLATHPTAIFVRNTIAGVVHSTSEIDERYPKMESDDLGYLAFHIIEWKGLCRTQRRFTPLSFYGDTRAEQVRSALAHCDRTSSHFIITFEISTSVDVYLYDLHQFTTFSASPGSTIQDANVDIIYPRLKAAYALNPRDAAPWSFGEIRQSWSQSCLLWDNYRIGILGFNVSHEGGSRKAVLALSVIDISPLLTRDESITAYDLHGEFRRRILDRTSTNFFYTTQNNRLLGNLPQYGTNNIWALRNLDPEASITLSGLALGRFAPDERFQKPNQMVDPKEVGMSISDGDDALSASDPYNKLVHMGLSSWIPPSEKAEDLDLDDRLGRVAIGMLSGKAYILEFV